MGGKRRRVQGDKRVKSILPSIVNKTPYFAIIEQLLKSNSKSAAKAGPTDLGLDVHLVIKPFVLNRSLKGDVEALAYG